MGYENERALLIKAYGETSWKNVRKLIRSPTAVVNNITEMIDEIANIEFKECKINFTDDGIIKFWLLIDDESTVEVERGMDAKPTYIRVTNKFQNEIIYGFLSDTKEGIRCINALLDTYNKTETLK